MAHLFGAICLKHSATLILPPLWRKMPESDAQSVRKMPENDAQSVRKVPESDAQSVRKVPESDANVLNHLFASASKGEGVG